MKVYFVRHGIAKDVGEDGVTRDAERPLSKAGHEKTRLAAMGLKAFGEIPDIIGSSPLVRAGQTAQIFRDVMGVKEDVEICDFMAPNGHLSDLIKWLKERKPAAAMFVGHMPDLIWMTNACLPENERYEMHFKKAAVACVSFEDGPGIGKGRLDWLHQPRLLRAKAAVSGHG